MPKPPLKPPLDRLESDIIETMVAGLKLWRPDLNYPESHSDMQACVRGLFRMFQVQRLAIPHELEYDDTIVLIERKIAGKTKCHFCERSCNSFYFNDVPVCQQHYNALKAIV